MKIVFSHLLGVRSFSFFPFFCEYYQWGKLEYVKTYVRCLLLFCPSFLFSLFFPLPFSLFPCPFQLPIASESGNMCMQNDIMTKNVVACIGFIAMFNCNTIYSLTSLRFFSSSLIRSSTCLLISASISTLHVIHVCTCVYTCSCI